MITLLFVEDVRREGKGNAESRVGTSFPVLGKLITSSKKKEKISIVSMYGRLEYIGNIKVYIM